MEEVKAGWMFDVSYVQQLQETLRLKEARIEDQASDLFKEKQKVASAQECVKDLQDQLAEARQALQESKNSEKELASELVKRTVTIKERNEEIEKLRQELVVIADAASDRNALMVSEHLDAWEREREKNRKLKDECEGYKREVLDLTSHHADLSRSYCKDYKIAFKKNRKLKKRLRKCEEQLKKVDSISGTLEDMFNIRG